MVSQGQTLRSEKSEFEKAAPFLQLIALLGIPAGAGLASFFFCRFRGCFTGKLLCFGLRANEISQVAGAESAAWAVKSKAKNNAGPNRVVGL